MATGGGGGAGRGRPRKDGRGSGRGSDVRHPQLFPEGGDGELWSGGLDLGWDADQAPPRLPAANPRGQKGWTSGSNSSYTYSDDPMNHYVSGVSEFISSSI